jgi:hypothetical protein
MSLRDWIRRRCSVIATPSELVVERGGRQVAVLSEPAFEDMFWYKWKITPLVAGVAVASDEFWDDSEIDNTVFRCKHTNAVADTAFWAGSNPVRDGRLVLRGAYVPYAVSFRRQPFSWLNLLLFGGGAYDRPTALDDDDEDEA